MGAVQKVVDSLDRFEYMVLEAVAGNLPPTSYRVQLVKGCRTDSITGGPYLRLGVFYDGVEVADVGLFFHDGQWQVAGSGKSIL